MSDPHPARLPEKEDKRSFLQKVAEFIHPAPESPDELIETLAEAEDNQVIGTESRVMLERVIRMADMSAGEVMVAAPRMDLINIDAPYEEILHQVLTTAHSRFPVYQGERENIIGILMAKDLLKLQRSPTLNIRALVRPAVFVPESKGLNDLLREFRANRNHLAVVIDEFGRVAGLVTIEDVLEEIVGEITDEYDTGAPEVAELGEGSYRVLARMHLEDLADLIGIGLDSEEEGVDTVLGLMAKRLGRVPIAGASVDVDGWTLTAEQGAGRRNRIGTVLAARRVQQES